MKEKIIFSADNYEYPNYIEGVAIICAPTGIMCTVQAGGKACEHPKVEGFPIYIKMPRYGVKWNHFSDCSWGCWLGEKDHEDDHYLENYGKEIDNFLININKENEEGMHFEFDFERKKELMEGWWPALIQFRKDFVFTGDEGLYSRKFKGYLHFGNCD